MKQQSFIDITPKNGWTFTATSFLIEHLPNGQSATTDLNRRKTVFKARTISPGIEAVEEAIKKAAHETTEPERFVEVLPFPHTMYRGTHRQLVAHGKRRLDALLDYASSIDKGLIAGFLLWGSSQTTADIFPFLRYLREASEGRAVAAVGGPLLGRRLPEIEADLFEAGADIINIGGGREFSQFIGKLTSTDRFLRDDDGYLHLSLPPSAPFFTAVKGRETTFVGNKVYVPPTLSWGSSSLLVSPPGIGCAGNCGFCGAPKHVRSHDESLFPLIPQLAQETQALIEKYEPGQDHHFKLRQLMIESPNPFERVRALSAFFDALDLSKLSHASTGFGESSAFILPSGVDKHLDLIDRLLTKYPKLTSGFVISLDATQYEDDNDLLRKTVGTRILKDHDFESILKNYLAFLSQVEQKDWKDRFKIDTNIIYHPGMSPEVYFKKADIMSNIIQSRKSGIETGVFVLCPYPGSEITDTWKGHYAPLHHMVKSWEFGHAVVYDKLSCWGNQFKHGDLFDCFTLNRLLYAKYDAKIFSYRRSLAPVIWDDRQEEYVQRGYINEDDIKAGRGVFMRADDEQRSLLDTKGPRIIPALEEIVDLSLDASGEETSIGHVRSLHEIYGIVKWFHTREKYLMEHSPLYERNENCKLIVEATEDMLDRFAPFVPLFKKVDERPHPHKPKARSTPFNVR